MCWTEQASLGMTLFGVFICGLVYFRSYRPGHQKIDIIIPLFYTVMEGFQWVQHRVGFESCDATNQQLTVVGFYLIWFQPVVWNYWGLKVSSPDSQRLFRCTTTMSLVAVLFGTIGLIIGFMKGKLPYTEEFLLQLGEVTCTHASDKHFYWLFNVDALAGFRPHWFTFLSLLCIPHFFRKNKEQHWWGPGWVCVVVQLAGFFFGGWYFGDPNSIGAEKSFSVIFTHTIASGWCAFSVPSGLFLPSIGKFYNKFIEGQAPPKTAGKAGNKKKN